MPLISTRVATGIAGASLALAALAGCGDDSNDTFSIAAIDVDPDQVSSVTFTAAGRSATYLGRDGGFDPGPGATREFATQLAAAADRVFPLNAYRALTEANPVEPTYGLVAATATAGSRAEECGAGCFIEIVSTSGERNRLAVGGRSFNGAGFYATADGDSTVYLLIAQSVSDIITFANGELFEFPPSAKVSRVDKVLGELGTDAAEAKNPAANYHPSLRQALAAEADRVAARDGKPGGNLVRAATSTQDQDGAKPERAGAAGVGAALPGTSGDSAAAAPGGGTEPPADTSGLGR